ncbi:metal-dependent transcriptional regulator [Parenemella sanctibonifatiensis]|uniref:metal-dependent transcriptional regulator n=1 Tax=Parenemella sanctibonifatiensis TaxID=2016505 RepID=UPI001E32F823|nr:metal-dependent transcriptional regulator [Parenemella sanctibonifatiensis]
MTEPAVSRMVEDYLTLIWKAYAWPGGEPSTTDLAVQLGVTPSTVSANLKKLARDGYLDYEPYGKITLTEPGRRIAVRVVRRHRLIEAYLVAALGLGWDEVHDEADRLEHAVSDLVLDRMDAVLGHPAFDPHGDPIPTPNGEVPADDSRALVDLPPGVPGRITRVSDRFPEVLRHLAGHQLTVGAELVLREVRPAVAMVVLEVGEAVVELSLTAAAAVRVRLD